MLRRVVELGVNLIDTADSYGPEVSENADRRGAAPLSGRPRDRDQGRPRRTGPGRVAARRRARAPASECCEGSLRRLRLDAIDLYQLHAPDPKVPLEESLGALTELQDEGKIRHIGLSNVARRASSSGRAQLVDVVSVQNRYNLVDRDSEDVLEVCEREGIGVHPVVPAGHRRSGPAGRPARRDRPRPRRHAGPGGARLAARALARRCCRSPARRRSSTSRRTSPPPSCELEPRGARATRRGRLIQPTSKG